MIDIDEDYKAAILRYERYRQLVSSLKLKRLKLIAECDNLDSAPDPDGFGRIETGTLCLVTAHNELVDFLDINYLERHSYIDVLEDSGCDSCIKSYKIKVGPLAEAKKEFGQAKRSISSLGKKIIKLGAMT